MKNVVIFPNTVKLLDSSKFHYHLTTIAKGEWNGSYTSSMAEKDPNETTRRWIPHHSVKFDKSKNIHPLPPLPRAFVLFAHQGFPTSVLLPVGNQKIFTTHLAFTLCSLSNDKHTHMFTSFQGHSGHYRIDVKIFKVLKHVSTAR